MTTLRNRPLALIATMFMAMNMVMAQSPDPAILKRKAPETFRAVFNTTKGPFTIEVYRGWSPLAADRLYQLIVSGFYNGALFFRVEPGFVTQFGIAADVSRNRFWDPKKIADEPRIQRNTRGTLAFARDGKNNRCTQLFLNNTDNPQLDTALRNGVRGFTPVARIVSGMDVELRLNARYGKQPAKVQDSLYKYGNAWFDKKFPGLDRIVTATILR